MTPDLTPLDDQTAQRLRDSSTATLATVLYMRGFKMGGAHRRVGGLREQRKTNVRAIPPTVAGSRSSHPHHPRRPPRREGGGMIARLFCRIFGHRFPPIAADHVRCMTCGRWF